MVCRRPPAISSARVVVQRHAHGTLRARAGDAGRSRPGPKAAFLTPILHTSTTFRSAGEETNNFSTCGENYGRGNHRQRSARIPRLTKGKHSVSQLRKHSQVLWALSLRIPLTCSRCECKEETRIKLKLPCLSTQAEFAPSRDSACSKCT